MIYTSEQILNMEDLYQLQDDASSGFAIKYQMTPDEIGWYEFIKGKYSIAEYIEKNTDGDFILNIDAYDMSIALENDCAGAGKAVMLSDDTAMQRIFFWLWEEDAE